MYVHSKPNSVLGKSQTTDLPLLPGLLGLGSCCLDVATIEMYTGCALGHIQFIAKRLKPPIVGAGMHNTLCEADALKYCPGIL